MFGLDESSETPELKFLPLGFSSLEVWLGAGEIYRRYEQIKNMHSPFKSSSTQNTMHFVVLKV